MAQLSDAAMRSTAEFLIGRTFLGALSESEQAVVARCGHVLRYAKGEALCHRGDDGGSLSVVLSGRIKISNVSHCGRETVLNVLAPGDILGEIAVLDGGERTADATALDDAEVFTIYRRDLLPILAANPQALMEVVGVLCQKLRLASEMLEDNQRPMRGRLAKGLVRLAKQHGATRRATIQLDLGMTQKDLGNYLALSRESTSRQLALLGEEGLIAVSGARIMINDFAALCQIAEAELA